MFKCYEMNDVEGELFHFRLCFINCESVLTYEPMFLPECSLVYSVLFSTMSNGILTVDELSCHVHFYSCLYVWF